MTELAAAATGDAAAARVERLRAKPWNAKGFVLPAEISAVPGMLSTQEKPMLYYLAREEYSAEGVITDLGSFLGGSTICFAAALRERSFDKPLIHAYDLFKLGPSELERYFPNDPPPDIRTRAIFDEHLREYLDLIVVHEGDVLTFPWSGEPIEFLFIDVAKSYKVLDHLLDSYFPALIPEKSLIIMQDYLWGSTGPWHHVVMEKLADYCEYIVDTDINSVVFSVKEKIPREVLNECRWTTIPREEKLQLIERAIEKVDTQEKKQFLIENRQILLDRQDTSWGLHYHEL